MYVCIYIYIYNHPLAHTHKIYIYAGNNMNAHQHTLGDHGLRM